MQNSTGRGKRAALLDVEEPGNFYRLETFDIPQSMLEERTGEDATEAGRGESFLRSKERISGRRKVRSRVTWKSRSVQIVGVLAALAAVGILYATVRETQMVLRHNSRFKLMSTRNVQVAGNRVVSRKQTLAFFAPDIGHSVFRVPLLRRQAELQSIDWVKTATVMRIWPNRLRVTVVERTPIAFARDGNSVRLVDRDGVLLDMKDSAAQRYSFPVLSGISASESASTRASRMAMYRQFVEALDADGGHASAISEVDLSDPEDLRAVFSGESHDPVVHLGDTNFLPRYRAYEAHIQEWLQQYPQLRSVDMRYGTQIVLDTGTQLSPLKDASANGRVQAVRVQPTGAGDKARTHTQPANRAWAKRQSRHSAHSAARHRTKIRKHSPERGHTVRDPIAHTINGA